MGSVTDKLKHSIKNWLEIEETDELNIKIRNDLDFVTNAMKNLVWYKGDANELIQLYNKLGEQREIDKMRFWAGVSSAGLEIQKRHTGIAGIIVDTLTDVVMSDFNGFSFEADKGQTEWDEIYEDNNRNNAFTKMLKKAVRSSLYIGDGAFKLTIDTDITDKPIIEFWGGEKIDMKLRRGRLDEIIFKSLYTQDAKKYELHEIYGMGYIKYELYQGDKLVPIETIPSLATMETVTFAGGVIGENDEVIKRGSYMMAVPMINGDSDRWEGRGQSIYDRKIDNFDALDEVWSQWMDALRSGRTKTYIPSGLIPRNPETGRPVRPNAFDNRFIAIESDISENGQNKVTTEAPAIQHDAYLASYVTALDLCLQGLISPSTLGIDTKKLDNAEAQREKEKTTLYSRQKIVDLLSDTLPQLVDIALRVRAEMNEVPYNEDVNVSLNFGEYANPSFESQVETVAKAKTQGIMSIEASIEELYGDSKDDEWKQEEVSRLKAEQGIVEMEEPAVNFDLAED